MTNSAGIATIEIRPDLSGFGRDLGRGIDPHVDRSADHVQSRLGGAFKAVAVAAGGMFAANAFKDIISGASDLSETLSKSNTIFGDQAKAIETWAGTAAKAFGQSKQGALDAAATFGNLFVQLGTGRDEAAKMSTQMVELASDFASFHNADPTDVIESMTAAFRGEFDAVQKYVPTINAAAVEQQALKMGLAATTKELTAQDKALATQALLMEGAGAAVGDFAKTSDGLANRQRILSAQFQDTKDKIGMALLPIVLKLMASFMDLGRVIGPLVSQVGEFIRNAFAPGRVDVTWLDTLISGVRALIAAFKNAADGVTSSGFAGSMERLGIAARQVFDFIKDNAKPILIGLAAAFAVLTAPITSVIAVLVLAYTRFEGFRKVVNLVVKTALEQFGNLVDWFKSVWPQITEAVGHVVEVIQKLWRTFGDEILSVAKVIWDQIRNVIETVVNIVRGIIQTVLALINGDWGRAWDSLKGILSTVWEYIRETVVNGLRLIREPIEAVLDVIRGIWERVWGGISSFFGGIWEGLKNAVSAGMRAVVDFFLAGAEFIIDGAARAFGWVPVIGDKLQDAARSFERFRDDVNAALGGIHDQDITLFLRTNDSNLGTAGDPYYAPSDSGGGGGGGGGGDGASGSGLDEYALGGWVKGPKGSPQVAIVHGGEYVVSEAEMARSGGMSGGTRYGDINVTVPGTELDPLLVAKAIAWELS